MADFDFTAEQLEAVDLIQAWYDDWQINRAKQVFFLTGQAGTGKTSLAQAAAEQCTGNPATIAYIAPTGKAASRLRQKGCENAKTLHSFAYNLRGEDQDGNPVFWEKDTIENRPQLVVMDEGSMVGEWDMNAVLKHGLPVLVLGDLGQLPPVKAPYSLTPDHVDFELTEILRQAADSNIIRAASIARKGLELPLREYDDVKVRKGTPPLEELLSHSGEEAQILCSFNNTRHTLNAKIRAALGFTSQVPGIGEKVICLFNQHAYGFMNGEQAILLGFEDIPEYEMEGNDNERMLYAKIKNLSNGKTKKVKFNPDSFSTDAEIQAKAIKAVGGFASGYAITVHKSQGSQWPAVMVIDEPMRTDLAKLRYTAWTRAEKVLTIYKR
jgi:exodeoxyribonuclease V